MKIRLGILTLMSCLTLTLPCEAKVLLSSVSGVINVPSANVRSLGHVEVMGQYTEDMTALGGNIAALPGLEVAYSRLSPNHGEDFNMYSAKYQFVPETITTPAVAVGVEDFGDEIERSSYVVATKEGPWGVRGHAGVGTGRFSNGFVALEKQFKVNSKAFNLSLALEYDGHDFNYGATVPMGKMLQAEAGVRSKALYVGVKSVF